jgi:hypothetical protein
MCASLLCLPVRFWCGRRTLLESQPSDSTNVQLYVNGDDERNGGVESVAGGSHRACADEIIYDSSSSKAPRPSRPKATRGSSNAESKGRRTKAAGSKNQKGKPKGEATGREPDKLDTKLDARAEKSGEISFSARPAMAQVSSKGEAFL